VTAPRTRNARIRGMTKNVFCANVNKMIHLIVTSVLRQLDPTKHDQNELNLN
jgi:hypothetical protein